MKIFKKFQEEKRQKDLSVIRNKLIHEINLINIKLESLQMLVVGLNNDGILPMNAATKSLLHECQFFAFMDHERHFDSHYSLASDWDFKRIRSSFDEHEKIKAVIDELKQQNGKPRNLHVFIKSILDYIEMLQKTRNNCVLKIFEADQLATDTAYLNYLESLNFRLDVVQEEAKPVQEEAKPKLEKTENEILIEKLAAISFDISPRSHDHDLDLDPV